MVLTPTGQREAAVLICSRQITPTPNFVNSY